MAGGDGCGVRGHPLVDALSDTQEALAQAVQKGHLTRDPLRFALGRISEARGAFLAGIRATRQPIDPAPQTEMVRQVIAAAAAGANQEAVRLARAHNRRPPLLAALTLFVVAAIGTGAGYSWGWASAAANIQGRPWSWRPPSATARQPPGPGWS
jgi:hypothetical protein